MPLVLMPFVLQPLVREEGNTTMDDGTHVVQEEDHHGVHVQGGDKMVVAHAGAGLTHNEVDNYAEVVEDTNDEKDRRDNQTLFHSVFERSPWLHQTVLLTRRVASHFVSSFVLRRGERRELCATMLIEFVNTLLVILRPECHEN